MDHSDIIRSTTRGPIQNPALIRTAYVARAEPAASDDGVRGLVRLLGPMASKALYLEWKNHPVTQRMVSALRSMALHQPPQLDQIDLAPQYGVTLGLVAAAQLLDDPASMLPVFQTPADADAPAEDDDTSYNTPGV